MTDVGECLAQAASVWLRLGVFDSDWRCLTYVGECLTQAGSV